MTKFPPHPDVVREAISGGLVKKSELSRRAGVHANTLAELGEGWNPRWKTLAALCRAIDEIKAERA